MQSRHPGGRPTKLTPEFLTVAESVILHEDNALVFTDEDLLGEINERLPEEARICKSTFKEWKSGRSEIEGVEQFLALIEKALRIQKRNLLGSLRSKDDPQWTRWAWIIERKFDEWNLRKKIEQDLNVKKDPAAELMGKVFGDDQPDTIAA